MTTRPSLARLVAATRRRGSRATVPLPEAFAAGEPGLLTREAYLDQQNPEGKIHPAHAYDRSVDQLNEILVPVETVDVRGHPTTFSRLPGDPSGSGGWVIRRDDRTVGVVHGGTLYHGGVPLSEIPRRFLPIRGEAVDLGVVRTERVKYPVEYEDRVVQRRARNRAQFPHLVQNLRVGGESLQVRAERPPVRDAGDTLVVLDAEGRIVGQASDEWGATLFMVPREYRGKGLGGVLGELWYGTNPRYRSGGYTRAGEENAVRLWESRVRFFASNGWYSELVRVRRLTLGRVRTILAGLSHRPRRRARFPELVPDETPRSLRVYANDSAFVVYDARFLEDPQEEHVLGYGLFRDAPRVGVFLYAIEYERAWQKLVTRVALQMARDAGDRLWVGEGYGDLLELDGIDHVVREGDHVWLDRDVLPLRTLAARERVARRVVERYGEKEALLLEAAESKWS